MAITPIHYLESSHDNAVSASLFQDACRYSVLSRKILRRQASLFASALAGRMAEVPFNSGLLAKAKLMRAQAAKISLRSGPRLQLPPSQLRQS